MLKEECFFVDYLQAILLITSNFSHKKNLKQFSYRVNSIKTRFELFFIFCNLRWAARHRMNFRPVIFNC